MKDCIAETITLLCGKLQTGMKEKFGTCTELSFAIIPDLKRILLYEEFNGHPLRKDYVINKRQPLIGPLN